MSTRFSVVHDSFLSKITDDMYLQLTEQDTLALLDQLLISAIPKFEFPRCSLRYSYVQDNDQSYWTFEDDLLPEEINVLATYMIVEWLGQQLATIENVRMKYSGPDYKFTSQANHMQKILQMKKDYQREGFHLQRLYKRRIADVDGIYHSTIPSIMEAMESFVPARRGS